MSAELCNATKETATGKWVCIKPRHDEDLPIPHPNETAPAAPNRDRHYWVKAGRIG